MKKVFSVILIILTILSSLTVVPTAFADSVKTENGFQYIENSDGTVSVVGYNYNRRRISIPTRLDNKIVVSIKENAFVNADNAVEYYIPFTVTYIAPKSLGYNAEGKKRIGLSLEGYRGTTAQYYARRNQFHFDILPNKVNINAKLLTLGKNEKRSLKATLVPKNAKTEITFKSSNDYIAKVDNNGVITAKNVGKAKIIVSTGNNRKRTCNIVVKKAPNSIKLSKNTMTLGRTEKLQLKTIIDSNSYSSAYTWKSSKKGIVQIINPTRKNVTIKALRVGTTTVSVRTYNGKTAKCRITVKKQPGIVKISRKELWLERNKSFDLDYQIAKDAYSNTMVFSSSNPSVVSVNAKTGKIKSHNKIGTAYISVRAFNGHKGVCKVKVKKQVGFNGYTGTTISDVLKIKPSTYMNWMKSHEDDNYYVNTKYRPFDCRNPNGDCKGKNGANNIYGEPGLNCTGFVWHALTIPARKSKGRTDLIPTLGGWVGLYESRGITRRQFSSVKEMLMSGFLEQGDILFIANKSNEYMLSNHHHVGIYWGNGESDVFWHSLGSKNRISNIYTMGENPKYIALKFQ